MLTTDQKKLAKLALSLRDDIDFLLESINEDLTKLNEDARTQFLEGTFQFLKNATELTEEQLKNHLLFGGTPLSAPPAAPAPAGRTSLPSKPVFPQGRRGGHRPTSQPHSLWFPNAPATATSALVAAQVYGGPLESLKWYEHYDDPGLSFLINFIHPSSAASFFAFARSPECTMSFPGTSPDWRPFITWSGNVNHIRPHVLRAVNDLVNPARRVLVFMNFPVEEVSKRDVKERMKALEARYMVKHWVDDYEIYEMTRVLWLVFSKVEAAMRVMRWWELGLLGREFDNCKVIFGRDPSDKPIPEVGGGGGGGGGGATKEIPIVPPAPVPTAPRTTSAPHTAARNTTTRTTTPAAPRESLQIHAATRSRTLSQQPPPTTSQPPRPSSPDDMALPPRPSSPGMVLAPIPKGMTLSHRRRRSSQDLMDFSHSPPAANKSEDFVFISPEKLRALAAYSDRKYEASLCEKIGVCFSVSDKSEKGT